MMTPPLPISDVAATALVRQIRPLVPSAQAAFIETLAVVLRELPPPVGDGLVFRLGRALLATGHYPLAVSMIVTDEQGERAKHYAPRKGRQL
jgi:hypothetical protein